VNEVDRACGTHVRGQKIVQDVGGKAQITRRRWVDEIRMDLSEIGWRSVELIQVAQDFDWWQALVNTVMNLQVLAPQI
jgi:hypothetical protein